MKFQCNALELFVAPLNRAVKRGVGRQVGLLEVPKSLIPTSRQCAISKTTASISAWVPLTLLSVQNAIEGIPPARDPA